MSNNREYSLLVKSAKQVVQVASGGQDKLVSTNQNDLAILEAESGEEGFSIVVNKTGFIEKIGTDSEVLEWAQDSTFENIIDAIGKSVVPGLVDGHTHAVWAGDRVHEFAMKLAGATYLDVHRAGGGINFTVRHVHQATEEELFRDLKKYLLRMLASGTTFVECKTGYGLTLEAELKMLRVIERAIQDPDIPMDISVTYCAAHAVPSGLTAEEATEDIVTNQIPEIQRRRLNREFHVHNIDVFCEKGVYNVEQTKRILKAGMDIGLAVNFHAEELNLLHSAEMGAELHSRAMSHLEEISPEGIEAMARSQTVAVLLPTTAHILRLRPPPSRQMIEKGVPVALGSDFNPNAHCFAMPIVMHLACIQLHLSMPEALVAATLNAAASLGKSDIMGSLEVGKLGDMLILDAPKWEHLIYQLGSYHHVIEYVVKRGKVVHQRY